MAIAQRPRLTRLVTGGIPNHHGDRFRPSDYLIDKLFLQGKLGDALENIAKTPSIISGGVVTQGTGTTLNITAGDFVIKDNQTPSVTEHNYDGTALSPTITIPPYFTTVSLSAQTNLAIPSAVLDGIATNYVKLSVVDISVQQRGPANAPASPYDYLMRERLAITVNTTAPTSNEILLTTFTGIGTFTFSADPDAGTRAYDFGIAISKIYAPNAGLDILFNHQNSKKLTMLQAFTAARSATWPNKSGTIAFLDDVTVTTGHLSARLTYDSTTTLPKLRPGQIEVGGSVIGITSEQTAAFTDTLNNNKQAAQSNSWYWLLADSGGALKYSLALYPDALISSAVAITDIVVSAGTATVHAVAHGAIVDNRVCIKLNTVLGTFKVLTVADADHFTVECTGVANGTYAGGTVDVYATIGTYHCLDGATLTLINGTASAQFTPNSVLNNTLNGYYTDSYGVNTASASTYRIIGIIGSDSSNLFSDKIFYPYKSGKDRNDNVLITNPTSDTQTTNTPAIYSGSLFTTIDFAHGNDYLFIKDFTNALQILYKTEMNAFISVRAAALLGNYFIGMQIRLGTRILARTVISGTTAAIQDHIDIVGDGKAKKNDIMDLFHLYEDLGGSTGTYIEAINMVGTL